MTRTLLLLGTGAVAPWVAAVVAMRISQRIHNRRLRAAT